MQPEAKTPNSSGFNTQPPEGSWAVSEALPNAMTVSTHSRPKAAGNGRSGRGQGVIACFNTQPPEGSWFCLRSFASCKDCFNTQPPEGSWLPFTTPIAYGLNVSTHSRPKAAGRTKKITAFQKMFQHTAARRRLASISA